MYDAIYLDMDGTLVDTYNVSNWLLRLRSHDPLVYYEAEPKVDMDELNSLLEQFKSQGIIIGIISWCSANSTPLYDAATRAIKRTWIKENIPCASEIHIVKYGTPKHKVANIKNSVLVDDNSDIRRKWTNGRTIDARQDILKELEKFLDEISNL